MLILRRRLDETIVVDGRIFITVTWLDGLSVKLGITAPPEVVVDRLEVHREKVAEAADQVRRAELAKGGRP